MAITAALLTTGNDATNLSVYTTASITPTANRLILAAVHNQSTGAEETPTLSGNGLTWVQVATATDAGDITRVTVFRAMGASPSAGAVTITFSAGQVRCGWSITEFDAVDTSGTDGSGAVVQSKTAVAGSGTAGTADFDAAFGDAVNNATYSALSRFNVGNTAVEGSFTELSDDPVEALSALHTMWLLGEDQTPAPTWTGSTSWAQVVVEIKAASAGAQSLTGSLFTKAPTFFTGAVTATRALTGSLFTKAPTFPTGAITTGAVALTGTLFTKAPSFFTGTVTAGAVTLTGVLFQKAPTFPQGVVSSGAVTLTGTLFTNAPTFPQGAVTAGAVNLTGVLFQKAPTFPTGAVTAAYSLTGTLFVKAPTFPTGTIGQAGTLFGTLFVKAPTFFTGSLAQGGPSFWMPDPAGWTANPAGFVGVGRYGPSPWGAELSGQRFEKAPTFPVGAVS